MIRSLIRCGTVAGAVLLGACDLVVRNPNQPEEARVLAAPKDVEALLSTQYLRWHAGVYGNSISNQAGMAAVTSFELFSSLANNGMGQVVSIPRPQFNNAVGNAFGPEHSRTYNILSEVTRITSNVLNKLNTEGFTLAEPGTGNTAQDARARSFAHFVRGIALGYLALVYDSAAIVSPGMSPEDPGVLASHVEVMDSALSGLQQALDAANLQVTGNNGFPLPQTGSGWIPSNTTFTAAEFRKLIRSYRARLRANNPRSPAENATVDWDAVIADAQNGITEDHYNRTSTTTGPFYGWMGQWAGFGLWHQLAPFYIGMADTSGSYAAYIATPLDARGSDPPFFLATPDLRFPQGATRAAQQADMPLPPCNPVPCKRYLRNRTTPDQLTGPGWGWSQYDYIRFHPWSNKGASALEPAGSTGANGLFPFFTLVENRMLEAEGHIRKGNFQAAAALINLSRVANGLAAITTFNGTAPVPGTNVNGVGTCVPKVPVGPSFNTVACGTILEAMKYEKRIETTQTHHMAWFLDARRWGDLVEGSGTCWATPYQDLQARTKPGEVHAIYSTGGVGTGQVCTAQGKGTYGWF
jgi:hypothetical protein